MTFAHPIGLLALLAVPVVLALHLFRRRLRQRQVAGLFLWAATAPRAEAGRRRARLQQGASLWLELALAIALALWLAGPRVGVSDAAPHVVIVLDDTASMAGRGVGGVTAAERAVRRAVAIAEALPNDGVATVVRSGVRPEVLCGPRAPAAEVARALWAWTPGATGHDLAPALELAVELGGADAELVLLTDRAPRDAGDRFRVEAFGVPAPNAAVLSARRVARDGGGETVLCDLAAWARELPARVVVADPSGAVRSERPVQLAPGRSHHLAIDVDAEPGVLTVRVTAEGDGLSLDDSCPLPPAPDRTVSFASALDPATAVRVDLRRVARALSGVALVDDPTAAHVRFTSRSGPLAPGHHEVVIAPVGDARDAWVGPFLLERRSGLCDGVTLDGVVWTAGRGAVPGDPLALVGAQVLAGAEDVGGGESLRLWLNLDATRSNLTASPDWPILLANVAEHARARLPGLTDVTVPVGGVVRYRGDTAGLALVEPDGAVRPSRGVGLATWEARVPGLCRVERDGVIEASVAVHFVDPSESDLTGRDAFVRPAVPVEVTAEVGRVEAPGRLEARVLALLLLGLLALDWWVLRAAPGGSA